MACMTVFVNSIYISGRTCHICVLFLVKLVVVGDAMMLGNFHCRGVLIIWLIVRQRPTALAVGAGGGCLMVFGFFLSSIISLLSPSLWETARYRLKY